MEQICYDILNKWAEYVDYDENQKQFNLLSWSYETHKVTKALKHIIEQYDESGLLAVLSIKRLFNKMLNDSRIKLYDVIANPDELKSHKEMYDLLNSEEILKAEKNYFELINTLITKVIGKNLIGEIDKEQFESKVFEYTNNVVDTLDKCRIEFYKKGGELQEITNFSTNIHVFPSLAECVLTLSNAPDGIYLCFIDISHTADGYFGFFIKSNGNLLSSNERINEAFKGQHCNSRNGRWAEGKADEIFPYEFIFSYENYDYKGYSHTYKIDESKLALFDLQEDAYLPLLIAMILLSKKFMTINPEDYDVVFIDSLLKVNIPLINTDKAELMVIEKNEIVQHTNTVNLDFDYNSIMDGSALDEFRKDESKGRKYNLISSNNNGQIFVDLYGEGFQIQPNIFSTQKLLSSGDYEYVPEFIGSETRFRSMAYVEIRKQLADYIRTKMYEEFESYGGMEAVNKWFKDTVLANLDNIKKLTVDHYMSVKKDEKKNIRGSWQPSECSEEYYITLLEDSRDYSYYEYGQPYMINDFDMSKSRIFDLENGTSCSLFFIFRPLSYVGIENMLGCEVPKIVKGWSKNGRRTYGNSLLDMTDAVESINTPFERYCSNRPEYEGKHTYTNFAFCIAFAKRTFRNLCKSYGYDINPYLRAPKDKKED